MALASKYVLVNLRADGMYRGITPSGTTTVIHKESVGVDQWGATCYSKLADAKATWEGPDSDTMILALDKHGAGCGIWMGKDQHARLRDRIRIWAGCYGSWTVRYLNG